MRGVRIHGFVVLDLLGSGRSGLLYSAAHETTGQKAIVQVVTREDGVVTRVFVQEASEMLGGGPEPELVTVQLDDGRFAHVLAKRDQRDVPTQRLSPSTRAKQPLSLAAIIFVVGVFAMGLGGAVGALHFGAGPPRTVQVLPTPTDAGPSLVPALPSEQVLLPPTADASTEVVAQSEPAIESPVARTQPFVADATHCLPDARWKRAVGAELANIANLAAADESLDRRYRQVSSTMLKYADAKSASECAAVEAALDNLRFWIKARSRATVKPQPPCEPSDTWREGARHTLAQLGQAIATRGGNALRDYPLLEAKLSRAIETATTRDECTSVEHLLEDSLRKSKQR